MHDLDDIDRKLLRQMQAAPEARVADLARGAGLSAAATGRRIARLEADGVITGYGVAIDPAALGNTVSVSLRITLDKTDRSAFDRFLAEAVKLPEVDSVQTLLGRVDVRLNVIARDLSHYQEIYREKILALPHVLDIQALMLVATVKETEDLPL